MSEVQVEESRETDIIVFFCDFIGQFGRMRKRFLRNASDERRLSRRNVRIKLNTEIFKIKGLQSSCKPFLVCGKFVILY